MSPFEELAKFSEEQKELPTERQQEEELSSKDIINEEQEIEKEESFDEDIIDKLPHLSDETDEQLLAFKQELLECIINYQIFEEEEFSNFYQAVCMKNKHVSEEYLLEVFQELKGYLNNQLNELLEQEDSDEENKI